MDRLQFLDGLTPLQRRLIQIVQGLSESDSGTVPAREVLRALALEEWQMDPHDFDACCDELNGFVGPATDYLPMSVGYAFRNLLFLGQPWRCRYPYLTFHGSIGDIHDDQPSGPDYLQLRISDFFRRVAPEGSAPFLPLSLLNGTVAPDGSEIPPHQLNELWMSMEEVRQNPEVTVNDVIEIMPGPDFASGGAIIGNEQIRSFYAEGSGSLTLRGDIQTLIEGPRTRLLVSSLPPGVMIKSITEQLRKITRTHEGIHGFKDASSGGEVRIMIDANRDRDASGLKELLFSQTDLQRQVPFRLPEKQPMIKVLRLAVTTCSPAWRKKSGEATDFIPFFRDILRHGGYKSPLSDLGDERRTRILERH